MYNREAYTSVNIHQNGYLSFEQGNVSMEIDCLNVTAYEEVDIVVAMCSQNKLTLVRLYHKYQPC